MNSCLCSSFIYLTNCIVAFLYDYYTYSFLFFMLFSTSILVHSNNNIYTLLLDKVSILCIVCYGGYLFYNSLTPFACDVTDKIMPTLIISTFIITIYVYYYGYMYNQYCYCEDTDRANKWHSFMHIVSSVGHHLILWGTVGSS